MFLYGNNKSMGGIMKLKNRKAFTMAEVLITLGIIGIIAAMTIPNLMGRFREKEYVNRLLKAYSTLSQAYQLMTDEKGSVKDVNSDERIEYVLKNLFNYLNANKFCEKAQQDKCIYCPKRGQCFKALKHNSYTFGLASNKAILLNNGDAIISMDMPNFGCEHKSNQGMCGMLFYLFDAHKEKIKTVGENVFGFYFTPTHIEPLGANKAELAGAYPYMVWDRFDETCVYTWNDSVAGPDRNGSACTAWVILNKNMDYLHCNLKWNGHSSCK